MRNVALFSLLLACSAAFCFADDTLFEKDVLPVLKNRCFKCHGEKKQKGDLRLDSKEAAFAEDYVIVPSDPEDSELYIRITLPEDDDDAMPPSGARLTSEQVAAINKWITDGADWPETMPSTEEQSAKQPSALSLLPATPSSESEVAAIEALGELGITVRKIAQNIEWKMANLRGRSPEVIESALPHLSQIKTLTDLNLADTSLTDVHVEQLASLTNLTRLHLEKNPITDAALQHLGQMQHVSYLNLYETGVSDDGLLRLHHMTHLRRLYVWQSKVTEDGAKALMQKLPGLEVVMGVKIPPPAKKEKAPEQDEQKEDAIGDSKSPEDAQG